jgi:hypothetical protein
MNRMQAGLLVAAAVFAVGSVSSASAAECKKEATKKFVLCLGEPLTLTEGSFPVTLGNDTTHSYVFKAVNVAITCDTVMNKGGGEIVSASGATSFKGLVIEFTECTVPEPPHCSVSEPIKTEPLKGTFLARGEVEFTPESGNLFAAVKFNSSGGTCLVAGNGKVTGSPVGKGQVCTAALEVTRENQLFECLTTGSHLKLGEEAATFSGDFLAKVLRESKAQEWAVIEGV